PIDRAIPWPFVRRNTTANNGSVQPPHPTIRSTEGRTSQGVLLAIFLLWDKLFQLQFYWRNTPEINRLLYCYRLEMWVMISGNRKMNRRAGDAGIRRFSLPCLRFHASFLSYRYWWFCISIWLQAIRYHRKRTQPYSCRIEYRVCNGRSYPHQWRLSGAS